MRRQSATNPVKPQRIRAKWRNAQRSLLLLCLTLLACAAGPEDHPLPTRTYRGTWASTQHRAFGRLEVGLEVDGTQVHGPLTLYDPPCAVHGTFTGLLTFEGLTGEATFVSGAWMALRGVRVGEHDLVGVYTLTDAPAACGADAGTWELVED